MRPLLIAVLAVATVCSACVDDNPGLVIEGNVQPDTACLVSAAGGTLVAYGVYDVALVHPYFAAPLFRSGLMPRTGAAGPPRAEPNDIVIEGAVVDLTAVDGSSLGVASYSVAMTAFVPTAVDGEPGKASGLVQAIPASVGVQLAGITAGARTAIVAHMTFFGHTTGGTAIDSNPWLWTVDVCTGCLQAPCETLLVEQCFAGQDGYQYQSADCPPPI